MSSLSILPLHAQAAAVRAVRATEARSAAFIKAIGPVEPQQQNSEAATALDACHQHWTTRLRPKAENKAHQ